MIISARNWFLVKNRWIENFLILFSLPVLSIIFCRKPYIYCFFLFSLIFFDRKRPIKMVGYVIVNNAFDDCYRGCYRNVTVLCGEVGVLQLTCFRSGSSCLLIPFFFLFETFHFYLSHEEVVVKLWSQLDINVNLCIFEEVFFLFDIS